MARNDFHRHSGAGHHHRHNEPSKGGCRVPARRLSMRKLREVLRLRFELKLGYQQIGRSCAIGVSTVHKYLKRAEAAGLTWPLPEDWDEARVEAALFPRRGTKHRREEPGAHAARLRLDPRSNCAAQTRDPAVAVGRIPAGQPGRLSLLAFLRVVPALALEARRGAAAGAQSRREDVRGLGRRDDSGL